MKRLILITISLMLLPLPAVAEMLAGRVVEVKSGDTFMIEDDRLQRHQVKLAGIDAPEEGQPYFHRSQKALADEVMGKTLQVHFVKTKDNATIIGKALHGSEDINAGQLQLGLAWYDRHDLKHISSLDSTLFAQQERRARNRHIGLWRDRTPIPPWVYRRNSASQAKVSQAHKRPKQ